MPEGKYAEAYEGTTGLREEFTGKITEAVFGYDSDYQNGQTMIARVVIEPDDGSEEIVRLLSCGTGWEPAEKGRQAQRENGKDPGKGFSTSCNYYRFFKSAFDTEWGDTMVEAGPPWDMAVWDGEPTFDFGVVLVPDMNAPKDRTKDRRVVVPMTFVSAGDAKKAKGKPAAKKADPEPEAEEAEAPKAKASGAAAAAKAKAAAAKAKAAGGDDDSADMTLLKTIASEADTHEEFIERAYGELDDADSLESFIVDEEFYTANHG